jgi:peptide/nickel transport system permease protein
VSLSVFVLRRVAFLALTLFIVSIVIFAVTEILPGDVATMIAGQESTAEQRQILREQLGLNRPAPERYLDWITGVARGDLGMSLRMGLPVSEVIGVRLRNSAALAVLAFAVGVPTAIALGIVAALRRDGIVDHLIALFTLFAVSFPEFVIGSFFIIIFATQLSLLPPASVMEPDASLLANIKYLILPALTLTVGMLAHTSRMTRASLIEVLDTNYVRTATLKGLPFRTVVLKHALRNALLPAVTVIAFNVGYLLGAVVVVETVFSYPGMGRLIVFSVQNRDVPLLQATVLIVAAVYALANLVADVLYVVLNPQIRY